MTGREIATSAKAAAAAPFGAAAAGAEAGGALTRPQVQAGDARAPSQRRLRIALIVTRMDVGGVPDHVMTLAREMSPRHDLTVMAAEFHPDHAQGLAALGVAMVALPLARLPDPVTDLRALRALRARLWAGGFDIVHTHMSKAALLGVLAARSLGVRPVVVNTAHNLGSLALTGRAGRAVFRLYDRLLLGWATDAVIVVSARVRAQVLALRLVAADRLVAVPNGIVLARFDAARSQAVPGVRAGLGVPEASVLVVCVARLVWFKGLDTLLAAFARVPADPPAHLVPAHLVPPHLVIVGAGPLRADLEAQAAQLGLQGRVRFAGERGDVPQILAAADVFALASVSEGMPISILEAMAAGLPVVATDVGGVAELVAEGVSGHVTPPGDAGAFGAALARLCADAGARAAMGQAGAARARAEFSAAPMAARTEAVYRDALARRGRG